MRIEQGTAHADVPHQYEETVSDSDVCHVCAQRQNAAVHTMWRGVDSASRQTAARTVPRIHG